MVDYIIDDVSDSVLITQVLHVLQNDLLPVTSSNGWRLSSFAHGVPLWRKTLSKDSLNDSLSSSSSSSSVNEEGTLACDLSLCASYARCHASPAAVWEALHSLDENLEWNPDLQYLQRYPAPSIGDVLPHADIGESGS